MNRRDTITVREARALRPAPGPVQLWRYDILQHNADTSPSSPVLVRVATVRATSHLKAAAAHGFPDDATVDTLGDPSSVTSRYEVRRAGKAIGWIGEPSGPADEGLLLRPEAAALAGLRVETWDQYRSRGILPGPDQMVGRTPLWEAATVLEWLATRPGQGAGGGRPRKVTP